jgi:MFS family permease
MKYSHPLWKTLRSLEGNQKACVFSEPLWAIPYNLFLPFASIYMAVIGLQDKQIGMVVSLGLAMQLIWGLFSGAIVNKYGRHRIMLIFGLLSWTVPCLLWATAKGYPFFILAVFFNSMQQVINNCFSCLIIEDGDSEKLVNIWTILNLIGLFSGFISPLAGLCIDRFTLVPTMRLVYILSMGLMSIKFILQYHMSSESEEGKRCIKECNGQPLTSIAFGGLFEGFFALKQSRLLLCVILGTLLTCYNNVQATFWPLFITKAYGVSYSLLSVFPLVTSITSIGVYMLVSPHIRIRGGSIRLPLLAGMGLHVLGLMALLIFLPMAALWTVFFAAFCEALALAVLGPLFEASMSIVIPGKGRARINSLIFVVMMLVSIPVVWIAGYLSQFNRALPMIMNLCIITIGIFISLLVIHTFHAQQVEEQS